MVLFPYRALGKEAAPSRLNRNMGRGNGNNIPYNNNNNNNAIFIGDIN